MEKNIFDTLKMQAEIEKYSYSKIKKIDSNSELDSNC